MSATVYYFQSSILSSASYVERRGKPPTWLPRQKLAEERIPRVTTKIENFLLKKIEIFEKKISKSFDPSCADLVPDFSPT